LDREKKCHISAAERHSGVPNASREPAGRQQWAEPRLEAVRKGKVGQRGVTDFGPAVERLSGQLDQSITRSQTIIISQDTKVNSRQPSKLQGSQPQGESSEAPPWEAYKEQDLYVETFGIGNLRVETQVAELRRLASNFGTITPWRTDLRRGTVSSGEKLSKSLRTLPNLDSRTWREGRAVDRFVVSRGVVLETPVITGEDPEQQLPKTPSAGNAKLPVRKGERSTR